MKEIKFKFNNTGYPLVCCPLHNIDIGLLGCGECKYNKEIVRYKEIVKCTFDESETKQEQKSDAVNHPNYYNKYSVEVFEMARRIWGDKAMKTACEITAFIYRMRAGLKPDNPIEQDLNKESWWLDKIKELGDE